MREPRIIDEIVRDAAAVALVSFSGKHRCFEGNFIEPAEPQMSPARGKGRVVPRQPLDESSEPQPLSSGVLQRSDHKGVRTFHAPNEKHHRAIQKVDITPQVDKSVVPTSNDSSSDWRCAGYVTANSKAVPELSSSRIAGSYGRKLLQSGSPVLLRQLHLHRCRLHPKNNNKHPVPTGTMPPPAVNNGRCEESAPATAPAATADVAPEAGPQPQVPVLCSPADANRSAAVMYCTPQRWWIHPDTTYVTFSHSSIQQVHCW